MANPCFPLPELVPLKLILQLTFHSTSLDFHNIWLQYYHITENDAHTEMKSYCQCVTFVRGIIFNIFIFHGRCSFVGLSFPLTPCQPDLECIMLPEPESVSVESRQVSIRYMYLCFLTPKLLNHSGQFLVPVDYKEPWHILCH